MSLSPSRLYEVFLNFLHVDVVAENHHRVARFYLCITRNEHSFFTANQSTDGYTDRHAEFLHRFLGYLRTFFGYKLSHIGVSAHQESHVHHVGIEHHLVDVAGGNHLLVDNGTDIQTLCHAHVVYVFYGSHRLAHPPFSWR